MSFIASVAAMDATRFSGVQDARGVAGLDHSSGGIRKDTGEAGGVSGEDVHGDGVAAATPAA
jgi:hypothetical protein